MAARLPDFLVIGGMRCGSTTLYKVLSNHPELFLPTTKELHFFDSYNPELNDDIAVYKNLFSNAENQQLCGEVTPDYLTTPGAFEKIEQTFSQVKLVAILRDPVERLCSHYLMSCAAGFEVLPFAEAITQEEFRLSHRNKIADIFHSYVERSSYLPNLKKYTDRFGVENMHVIFFEELINNSEPVLQNLWEYLAVKEQSAAHQAQLIQVSNRSSDLLKAKHSNVHKLFKDWRSKLGFSKSADSDKPEIDLEVKNQLVEQFQQHNSELSMWLGRELPWQ